MREATGFFTSLRSSRFLILLLLVILITPLQPQFRPCRRVRKRVSSLPMKSFFPLLIATAAFAFTSCEKAPDSGDDTGSADKAQGDGFVELFNGENLDGWSISKENPDSFSVKDGILIVKGGKSHLFYSGDVNGSKFKDFELKVRAKTFPGANSGVYFHTEYQDEGWPDKGYECQVNSTHKDPKKTGSLYAVKNIIVLKEGQDPPKGGEHEERDAAPSTDGEWFDYDISVKGKRIVIKVNGETTVDYTEPEGGPGAGPGRILSDGTFGIQAHDPDSEVHYERFAVKPL